jgi:hypothetical protein
VLVNGDEFEKIDVCKASKETLQARDPDATNNNSIIFTTTAPAGDKISVRVDDDSGVVAEASQENGEMMRELVRSKELLAGPLPSALNYKRGSVDSDASSESALVSTSTTQSEFGADYLSPAGIIRHEVIRAAQSDSECDRPVAVKPALKLLQAAMVRRLVAVQ